MDNKTLNDIAMSIFGVFPEMRRLVHEAFDRQDIKLTRTQQIILMTMANAGVLSMSELATRINTSNEQATRAVSQLISLGFMERFQNERNHRIVNIALTNDADEYLNKVRETTTYLLAHPVIESDDERCQKLARDLESLRSYFK